MTARAKPSCIGQPVPLIDGIEKVTGKALYTSDLECADALVGRILRSPVSHGEIVRIDVSKALALPGVRAVVTGADCPHTFGVIPIAMARVDYGEFGHTGPEAVMDTIGVDPGYRGHGVGQALMSQLNANLATLRVDQIRTELDWNDVGLIRYLDALGFAPAQRVVLRRHLV